MPATAPDSIPGDILDNLDPEYRVPPNVLAVTFEPGLTRERKTEILVSVGGEAIIGGAPFPLLDGIYLVRVSTGDDMQVLLRARDALDAQEEVVSAGLFTQLSSSPVTQETLRVPAAAPDTIPGDILDNLDPEYGVPPDVLAVTFKSGLTRERKAEILASVGGEAIIGGLLLRVSDGIYIVRVDTGDDMQVLLQARDDLNALEEVVAAGLLTQISPSGR